MAGGSHRSVQSDVAATSRRLKSGWMIETPTAMMAMTRPSFVSWERKARLTSRPHWAMSADRWPSFWSRRSATTSEAMVERT